MHYSAEDRVVLWYEYFRKLLGKLPEVTDENKEILTVFENLHIKEDIFTLDEYKKAKKSIKCGEKRWVRWYTSISRPLKYVLIDDFVLNIINNYNIHREQPDLWNISRIVPVGTYLHREISSKLITTVEL